MKLAEVRKYVQKEYWESGKSKGISGYEAEYHNWWWINRWMQCFNSVFPVRDKIILDLGCGYGSMVAGFQTWGADAYGIDLSDYGIEKGKQLADYLEHRLFQGSIHDLSNWGDNTFDILYSNQVFEHLPEELTAKLCSEIARIMKPDGVAWFAFVVSAEENGVRGPDDPDETHINIHNWDWWNRHFSANNLVENISLRDQLKNVTTGYDHFSYFKEYGWESIVLEKK